MNKLVDEKKDLTINYKCKKTFESLFKYPNTEFALDANLKLDLIMNFAAKEMYIGRYYFDKKKWISAINRFRSCCR